MATTDDPGTRNPPWIPRQRPWPRRVELFRFTVKQFYRLDELDFFGDRHVELIRAVLHEVTQKPGHATSAELTSRAIRTTFGHGWAVREMKPLDTGRGSLLEPDSCVVAGSTRDFAASHPTTAALLTEISDSTSRKDRTIKAHLYAQAGIADYWIVNLVDRQLEVHRQPQADTGRKGRFRYGEVTIVPESGRMSPLAAPRGEIAVADLLP